MSKSLWHLAEALKAFKWVELSHWLGNDSPYWEGFPEGVVELGTPVLDFAEHNFQVQTFKFPGQFGTHVDYPGHFIQGARINKDFSMEEMVLPMVVIDISKKVAKNHDYEVTLEDIMEFEEVNGQIPSRCFVALRTDWSKRWPDGKAISNADSSGQEHFPGWSLKVLQFLYETRLIAANGHETLDTDSAMGSAAVGDLICERYLLSRNAFQIEAMTNLDLLPPTGALLFAATPKIECANGLPVRAWAIFDD